MPPLVYPQLFIVCCRLNYLVYFNALQNLLLHEMLKEHRIVFQLLHANMICHQFNIKLIEKSSEGI